MNVKGSLLALIFAVCCSSADAQSEVCPPYVEPEIIIDLTFKEPRYDNALKMEELNRLYAVPEGRHLGGKTILLDSTNAHSITMGMNVMTDGSVCVQAARLEFTPNFDVIIYVPREFPPNSCSHQTILGHELEHVKASRDFSKKISPMVQEHIQNSLRYIGVVHARSFGEASELISRAIEPDMTQLSKNLAMDIQRNGEMVDTPEEYKRVRNSCNGETVEIADRAIRQNPRSSQGALY
jgi:hypothetical protein